MCLHDCIFGWAYPPPRDKAHPHLARQMPLTLAQSFNETTQHDDKPIWARSILTEPSRQENYINLSFLKKLPTNSTISTGLMIWYFN